jgi:hypothetical protein
VNTALTGAHYPLRIITHHIGRSRVEETVCGRCIRRLGPGFIARELWPCRRSGQPTSPAAGTSP